jgi:hypothetical protein
MFLGLLAAPAVADEPTEVNLGDFMYTHVNPCTGLEHDLYFENVTYWVHDHLNQPFFVKSVPGAVTDYAITGYTSDGYDLVSGGVIRMENNGGFTNNARTVWRHPDGSQIVEQDLFHFNAANWDERIVDSLRPSASATITSPSFLTQRASLGPTPKGPWLERRARERVDGQDEAPLVLPVHGPPRSKVENRLGGG